MVLTGLDVLAAEGFARLKGASIGVVCNQASVDSRLDHILDLLLPLHRSGFLRVKAVFGPQHGLGGHTQDNMIEWEGAGDERGWAVYSLYGEHREPTPEMLDGVELLVVDLPDVGARYYTFVWTLALCMRACSRLDIPVLVLDRPNPIGGVQVEGTVLRPEFASFVGLHPLPMRHGMTIGEVAGWLSGAHRRDADATASGHSPSSPPSPSSPSSPPSLPSPPSSEKEAGLPPSEQDAGVLGGGLRPLADRMSALPVNSSPSAHQPISPSAEKPGRPPGGRDARAPTPPPSIIQMRGWRREMYFEETGLPWVMPSPNMPAVETAVVYPGGCLIEGTNLSEGRGTTRPFETVGAPYLDSRRFTDALNGSGLPGVKFRAVEFEPTFNKHAKTVCGGCFIHVLVRSRFEPVLTTVAILQEAVRQSEGAFQWKAPPYEYEYEKRPIDILAGNDWLADAIETLMPLDDVRERFRLECAGFEEERRAALLY